jgi:hypothetical protein
MSLGEISNGEEKQRGNVKRKIRKEYTVGNLNLNRLNKCKKGPSKGRLSCLLTDYWCFVTGGGGVSFGYDYLNKI